MTEQLTGFLLIDKPAGWTSHDVVAKLRSRVGRKVGHAGTLDPMATGLLVLGLGRCTRLLRFVQGAEKEYAATAVFGVATDSLDADGSVLERSPMPVSEDEVAAALRRFVGTVHQVPPMVSARKVEGRRLYDIAREGGEVHREAKPVTIHELELTDFSPCDYPEVSFRVVCSTGTYVRTLADDVARSLGGRAHLTQLRRIRNGSLRVDDAFSMDDVLAADDPGACVVDAVDVLTGMPALTAGAELARGVAHGVVLTGSSLPPSIPEGPFAIVDESNTLLAVYRRAGARAKPEVVVA